MGILSWIGLGLVAGALAKLVMPGDQKSGCLMTIVLGVVGAFVGGYVGTYLGIGTVDSLNVKSIGIATGGAFLVLLAARMLGGGGDD